MSNGRPGQASGKVARCGVATFWYKPGMRDYAKAVARHAHPRAARTPDVTPSHLARRILANAAYLNDEDRAAVHVRRRC